MTDNGNKYGIKKGRIELPFCCFIQYGLDLLNTVKHPGAVVRFVS